MIAARSLAEAYSLRATATQLLLRASQDVRCMNIMCEHVGNGCACRLALSLGRMTSLKAVDISTNALPILPDSLFEVKQLEVLAAGGNNLKAVPPKLAQMESLRALDLSNNKIDSMPWEVISKLPLLRTLVLSGNPLGAETLSARERASVRPDLKVITDTELSWDALLVS